MPESESGVEGGAVLLGFADAVLGGDTAEISRCRALVVDVLGEAAMVDAAAVIANFQRMVRIASSGPWRPV